MNDLKLGYRLCTECNYLTGDLHINYCPRCHSQLIARKTHSIQHTVALALVALLLYIPANIYPIMIIQKLNHTIASTIIGGIIELYQQGLYLIGTIVFLASVTIPLIKIFVLFYLAYQTQRISTNNRINFKLFKFLKLIGKWSMLDIYVITIFIALVKLSFFTKVSTGPAAIYFTLVVIFTLLAGQRFDPRLLWDDKKEQLFSTSRDQI